MDRRHLYFLLFLLCTIQAAIGQQRSFSIKGVVKDASSGQPIPFANVVVWNTTQGAVTDSTGLFEISGISPGSYRLQSSFLGYKPFVTAEFRLANKDIFFPIELEEASQNLQEVSVVASPFRKTAESPLGLRVIGFKEIEKSAGGNRDISRVVQTFPGVASTAAFRNDLMVRGGGPSENRFFLDGVEIPNINHFSTQGASGGPVGIINPDFIREVNFYSAAFPASKGNTLSSVLDFKLQDGNKEKFSLRGVLGASDIGVSANGPLGKKTTYQVSVRRSYLQFLFDMIGLPFLPTFTDAQFKIKHSFNPKNELTVLGLGAIDDMKLNTGMEDMSEKNQYILSYLPVVKQKTYTLGAVYKHYAGKNLYSVIISRSQTNNKNIKYKDNDESKEENLSLNYRSDEIENKFRTENTFRLPFIQLNVGGNIEYAQYTNDTYQKQFTSIPRTIVYQTDLGIWKWGIYATAIYESYNERFTASLGVRADANNYSSDMNNLLDQLSPRLSLSYRLSDPLYINANIGRYYELPPYTTLGFKDNEGNYVNRTNHLSYIRSDQAGLGLEYRPTSYLKFTAEGFYKHYDRYPMSILDSIPLASKGTDYGVLGNEAVSSTATGRAYGLEIMGRWVVAPTASTITEGQSLSESLLSGGVAKGADGTTISGKFEWADASAILKPGNSQKKEVIFTSYDPNYEDATTEAEVTVKSSDALVVTFAQPENGSLKVYMLKGEGEKTEITSGTAVAKATKLTIEAEANPDYELAVIQIGEEKYTTSPVEIEVDKSLAIMAEFKPVSTPPGTDVAVTGVSLNITSKALAVGESFALQAKVTPNNATMKTVSWSSSDETVATVDADGVVTALKIGTCKITVATDDGNKTASCVVTVSGTVGIEQIINDHQIYCERGAITVHPARPISIRIIAVTGVSLYGDSIIGTTRIPVSTGIYLIEINENGKRITVKVNVR